MMLSRQKEFKKIHQQFCMEDLQSHTSEDGTRYYDVGNDSYPSVTTVLGYFKRKGIMEWRARVGEEEAKKISGRASRRGTTIHNMIEAYLNNESMNTILDKRNLVDIETFKNMMPTLSRIDNIILQEKTLHSPILKVAGRVDLIAEFDGVKSVIDFKTSLREKKEEYIIDYLEQATAYAFMFKHLTEESIEQIVIIIANDESPEPQVFVRYPAEYVKGLLKKIEEFRLQHIG